VIHMYTVTKCGSRRLPGKMFGKEHSNDITVGH
jgi:hypothetical protein